MAVQRGQWYGTWQWTQIGIYKLNLYPGYRILDPIAADEDVQLHEHDNVQDSTYNESTQTWQWTPDDTLLGHSCESRLDLAMRELDRYSADVLGTTGSSGPAFLYAASNYGSWGCTGVTPSPNSSSPWPSEYDPGWKTGYKIPKPGYSGLASGGAKHQLECEYFGFHSQPGADPRDIKGDRSEDVAIQYFPPSQLARYKRALRKGSEQAFDLDTFESSLGDQPYDQPTTPFKNPPKNGCHKVA